MGQPDEVHAAFDAQGCFEVWGWSDGEWFEVDGDRATELAPTVEAMHGWGLTPALVAEALAAAEQRP